MDEATPPPSLKWPTHLLAAVLILVAIFWGGATERVPQGVVLAGMGMLMLFAPPTAWPERKWLLVVGAWLVLAAVPLLPAIFFYRASWRDIIEGSGISISDALSPQPRLTGEAWLLLAAGIAWTSWLMVTPWTSGARTLAARVFVCGLTLLAFFVVVQWSLGWSPPGWLSAERHGPFPNRNHTAHVLALGGVLAVGCGADALRRGRLRMMPWMVAGGMILAGLAASYSRGGIVMLFWALGLWVASVAYTRKSLKILLLGLSALFMAAAMMLVFGGPVAARFAGGADSSVGFRLRIWNDASALASDSPWCGAGLGNFAGLFPFYRATSVIQSSIIHPESDWLWLVTETGWLATACAFAAVVILLSGAFPNRRGSQRRLRSTALAASFAAVLHGFVDVPGHRLGSALAAIFVMVLARKDTEPATPSRVAPIAWRVLGLSLVALGVWWLNVPNDEARAEALSQDGRHAAAVDRASRAIAREPLGWRPYFTRAVAQASQGKVLAAVADFRLARMLEPHHAIVPLQEGKLWIGLQPELAFTAWQDALARCKDSDAAETFARISRMIPDDPAYRARLLALVEGRDALQIDWFINAPREEALPYLERFKPLAERCDERRRSAFDRRASELASRPAHEPR